MTERPPPPPRRRRWLSIGIAAAAIVGLGALGYSCFAANDRSTYSAPAARLAAAPDGVTYVANGNLYVVAQGDGSVLALDEADRAAQAGQAGCIVRWLPDAAGGRFQADDRCGPTVFDRTGTPRTGGAALFRHPLRVAGKSVVVDIRQCMAPEGGPARSCAALRH